MLLNSDKIREHAIEAAKENDNDPNLLYIEFGVFSGTSINYFSKKLKKIFMALTRLKDLKKTGLEHL